MDTKHYYVCVQCKEQLDVDYSAKDTPCPHICQVCRKMRHCRLSRLRKVVCICHCPCKACREVQRKRQ